MVAVSGAKPVYNPKKLLVRMPAPLHAQIAEFAHRAGVSMNTVCVAFLQEGMQKMTEATKPPKENTNP